VEDGADDYGGSGSGWTPGDEDDNLARGGGLDEAEDLLETLMILGLFGLLGCLAWVRGRYLANAQGMGGVDAPPAMAMPGQAALAPEQAGHAEGRAEEMEMEAERREREALEALGLPVGWEPPLP
jgi:hypothetical protein